MKCVICNKEFKKKAWNQMTCSKVCKKKLNKLTTKKYRKNHKKERAEQGKIWRQNNPERVIELKKKWEKNNQEKVVEMNKKYREANKKKCNESCRRWKKDNPKKVAEILKRWNKANPEKRKAHDVVHKKGLKAKDNCEICGISENKKKLEQHHEDYDKPLETITLCRQCHKNIHKRGKSDGLKEAKT